MTNLQIELIIIAISVAAIIGLDLSGRNKNWGAVLMLVGLTAFIAVADIASIPHRFLIGLKHAWVAPVFVLAAGFATDYFQQSGAMSVLSARIKGIWSLGIIVFVLSMFFDNTIATLIGLSLVSVQVGRAAFATAVALWALLGGLFMVIGDITTLMAWLGHKVTPTGALFALALPSLAGFVVYTLMVKKEIHFQVLKNTRGGGGIKELGVALALFLTIPIMEMKFHVSPGITVVVVAFVSFWVLHLMGHKISPMPHDPKEMKTLNKTAIYIALVLLSVGIINPELEMAKQTVKSMSLTSIFTSSLVISSHVDNIPWTALLIQVLEYAADSFEWFVVLVGVGLGGGLSPIGSTSTLLSSGTMGVGFLGFYKYALKMLLTIGVVLGVLYLEKLLGLV